jgi:hypothetical protein
VIHFAQSCDRQQATGNETVDDGSIETSVPKKMTEDDIDARSVRETVV